MGIPPILFAFAAPFGFTCLDAVCGYMVNLVGMSVFQVMCFRNTLASSILLPYLLTTDTPHVPLGPPGYRLLLWGRGLAVASAICLIYSSMRYLTLSEYWMVNSCAPFPAALLCRVILGEKAFTRVQGVCCVLSILGVMLITGPFASSLTSGLAVDERPTDPVSKLIGIALGLASILVFGLEVVILRVMGDQVELPQILATLAITPAVVSATILLAGQYPLVWPGRLSDWILLCATVPFGWLGQYSLTKAAHHLSGVTMTLTMYTGLFHSNWIQWAAYQTYPSMSTVTGMTIIVGSGIVSAVYGTREDKDGMTRDAEVEDATDATRQADHVPLLEEPNDRA